ncbi:hypothetical protein FB45DRAFT_687506, partial [Roridomyces roridus]
RNRPIGDLYAMNAELALQSAQPYPGDEEFNEQDCFGNRRFTVHRASSTEHAIMDSEGLDNVLIASILLEDPNFTLSLWYAHQRQEAMGLELWDTERFLGLGDAF